MAARVDLLLHARVGKMRFGTLCVVPGTRKTLTELNQFYAFFETGLATGHTLARHNRRKTGF